MYLPNSESDASIVKAISAFVSGADAQQTATVNAVLDEAFRVVFTINGSDEIKVMDRATFMDLLANKKLGGSTRHLVVLEIKNRTNLARASVLITGSRSVFDTELDLALREGKWRIIHETTVLTPEA